MTEAKQKASSAAHDRDTHCPEVQTDSRLWSIHLSFKNTSDLFAPKAVNSKWQRAAILKIYVKLLRLYTLCKGDSYGVFTEEGSQNHPPNCI